MASIKDVAQKAGVGVGTVSRVLNNSGYVSDETREKIEEAMKNLRSFMFEHVYTNSVSKKEEPKAKAMVIDLFGYYMDHVEELPDEFLRLMDQGDSRERVVCDYIAGMSDGYAIDTFTDLFVPKAWKN